MHKLRKLLTREPRCNPFSDSYEYAFVEKKLEGLLKKSELVTSGDNQDDDGYGLIHTLFASSIVNHFFVEGYRILKESLLETNAKKTDLLQYCISFVNRELYVVFSQIAIQNEGREDVHYDDFFSYKIPSADASIGEIDARAALESSIDSIVRFLNFMRYFSDDQIVVDAKHNDIHTISRLQELYTYSNFLNVVKGEYDECVWNGGWMLFDPEKKLLFLYKGDINRQLLEKIGYFRLVRNSQGFYISSKIGAKEDKVFATVLDAIRERNYAGNKIEKVSWNTGFIDVSLISGIDERYLYSLNLILGI